MVGLKAALDFYQTIRPERVYARIYQLAIWVRDRVRSYPPLSLSNATEDASYAGIVSFESVATELKHVLDECNGCSIRIVSDPKHIRILTPIFNQPAELNAFFDALDASPALL